MKVGQYPSRSVHMVCSLGMERWNAVMAASTCLDIMLLPRLARLVSVKSDIKAPAASSHEMEPVGSFRVLPYCNSTVQYDRAGGEKVAKLGLAPHPPPSAANALFPCLSPLGEPGR